MAQAAQAPRVSRMKLGSVVAGRLDVPLRTMLYGVEGIGKSTFGAQSPKPIFLCAESGTSQLDVARFPEPKSWSDVFDAVRELTDENHDYKTLVIDTLDWLEPLCWDRICERGDKGKRVESIESFGYGRGFQMALDEWRLLIGALEKLIATKRTNVILLAHSQIRTFKNPEGDDYDRWELKLHAKAAGRLKEWCDDVLFAKYETFSTGKDTRKAVSDGARVVHTNRMAAWDAKNRNGLPDTMPLSWDEYFAAVKAHAPKSTEDLRVQLDAAIGALPVSVDDATKEKIRSSVETNRDDAIKLSAMLNWCLSKTGISNQGT